MAIPLNWPVLSNTKRPICLKFARIYSHPVLTAKKWLDKRWLFKRGALYYLNWCRSRRSFFSCFLPLFQHYSSTVGIPDRFARGQKSSSFWSVFSLPIVVVTCAQKRGFWQSKTQYSMNNSPFGNACEVRSEKVTAKTHRKTRNAILGKKMRPL